MSDVSTASDLLRELSLPWSAGEYVKQAIDRTARMAKLEYWRAFDLWYRKARKVEEYELDQIKEALRIKNERAARNELHEAKLILARLEARLNQGDADFHSPHLDVIRAQTSRSGGGNFTRGRMK